MSCEQQKNYMEKFKRETDLINERLTQLIGSQSLIFAGYALMLTVKEEDVMDKEKWNAALQWLPYLGIWTAILIIIGLLSAVIASCLLSYDYYKIDKIFKLGVHPVSTLGGWVSAIFLPVVFIYVWYQIK